MYIDNINDFEKKFKTTLNFFKLYKCTTEVLEHYIKNYDAIMEWWHISIHQELTEEFIEKYHSHMDWWNICEHQKISEQFIENHINNVLWFPLCKYQPLSLHFIEKYENRLSWSALLENTKINLPFDILDKHLYSFNLYSASLESNSDGILKLIEKYPYKYYIDKITHELYDNTN